MTSLSIQPFKLDIPDSDLEDLHRRLAATRWPPRESVSDWSQGVPLTKVQALCSYWQSKYDWRRCESLLNSWPQYTTTIDGCLIYFLHVRSSTPDALPMLMTHGWPGSILKFRHILNPLTAPTAHGGSVDDAFHLVIPALPGHGFSSPPRDTGWNPARIARAWVELMQRLGYRRWVAQGGDWGCNVSAALGKLAPDGLAAIHLNTTSYDARAEVGASPTEEETRAVQMQDTFQQDGCGYSAIQETRPQTLGYGLADSPAGQAAWIYEKLWAWSDHDGDVESVLHVDEMLDDVMVYWLSNAAASSARLYWEKSDTSALEITLPVGISQFGDVSYMPRRWAERYYKNIIHWKEVRPGGHFAAWEQPRLFCAEVRECFRQIRSTSQSGQ